MNDFLNKFIQQKTQQYVPTEYKEELDESIEKIRKETQQIKQIDQNTVTKQKILKELDQTNPPPQDHWEIQMELVQQRELILDHQNEKQKLIRQNSQFEKQTSDLQEQYNMIFDENKRLQHINKNLENTLKNKENEIFELNQLIQKLNSNYEKNKIQLKEKKLDIKALIEECEELKLESIQVNKICKELKQQIENQSILEEQMQSEIQELTIKIQELSENKENQILMVKTDQLLEMYKSAKNENILLNQVHEQNLELQESNKMLHISIGDLQKQLKKLKIKYKEEREFVQAFIKTLSESDLNCEDLQDCWKYFKKILNEWSISQKIQKIELNISQTMMELLGCKCIQQVIPFFVKKIQDYETLEKIKNKLKKFLRIEWMNSNEELEQTMEKEFIKKKWII